MQNNDGFLEQDIATARSDPGQNISDAFAAASKQQIHPTVDRTARVTHTESGNDDQRGEKIPLIVKKNKKAALTTSSNVTPQYVNIQHNNDDEAAAVLHRHTPITTNSKSTNIVASSTACTTSSDGDAYSSSSEDDYDACSSSSEDNDDKLRSALSRNTPCSTGTTTTATTTNSKSDNIVALPTACIILSGLEDNGSEHTAAQLETHPSIERACANEEKDDRSRYDLFVQWLEQESWFKKIILSLLIRQTALMSTEELNDFLAKFKNTNQNTSLIDFKSNIQVGLPRFIPEIAPEKRQKEGLTFYGSAIPIEGSNEINRATAIVIDNFFKGIKCFSEEIWPLLFSGLFAHDVICQYAYPDNRYGTELWQILAGIPTNQQTLTTYLNEKWWWPFILMTTPIILGFNRILQDHAPNESYVKLQHALENYKSTVITDFVKWLNPFYELRRHLTRLESTLLWDRHAVGAEVVNWHEVLGSLAGKSSKITHLNVLRILAKEVDSLDPRDLKQLSSYGIDVSAMRERRNEALAKLRENSQYKKDSSSLVRYLYANYFQWSIGRSEKRYLEPFFWLYEVGMIYAKLRLYESLIQFFYQKAMFLINQNDCRQEGKFFTYMPQSAKYECTVCGDWPRIYYHDVFAGQSCLDGALKQQKTANETLAVLNRVEPFGITEADFSRQNWPAWNTTDLSNVLHAIYNASGGYLKKFNLSSAIAESQSLSIDKAQILASFLSNTTIEQIDFGNRNFTHEIVKILAAGMANNSFVTMNFQGNDIGVEGAEALAQTFSTLSSLRELDLSSTGTTDEMLQYLVTGLEQMNFNKLSLRNNNFTSSGLKLLAKNISAVNTLDISENNFFDTHLKVLAQGNISHLVCVAANVGDKEFIPLVGALPNSTITRLDMSGNQLTVASANALGDVLRFTGLQEIYLDGNPIGDEGLEFLSMGAVNATLNTLKAANTGAGDSGMRVLSTYLPQTNITTLGLGEGDYSSVGTEALSKALSKIEVLDISQNHLTDDGIKPLIPVLSGANCTLKQIDLSGNLITPVGAELISTALVNNTNLESLILSDNKIYDNGFTAVVSALPSSQVSSFECNACEVTEVGAKTLADNLNATRIESIVLNNNQLGDNGVQLIAAALLQQPIPHIADSGEKSVCRDFTWAIRGACAVTNTTQLSLSTDSIGNTGARSLCRVLPSTDMTPDNINLNGNPIDQDQVDIESCWISSASSVEPPFFSVVRQLSKININSESTQSFLHTIMEIMREINIDHGLILNLAAFALAFRQEVFDLFFRNISASNQQLLQQYISGAERLVLANFTEMTLRIKYAGVPSVVHDITLTCKQAYQKQNKEIIESKSGEASSSVLEKAAIGVGVIIGAYGVSFVVGTLLGNPTAVALALPIIFNSKKIIAGAVQGYKRYGLFGGAYGALESFAFSVPGGSIIEKALAENEAKFELYQKKQ